MTETQLYIKQHNKTGLLYFGKSIYNLSKYHGSGKYWRRHLKTNGVDVTTVWSSRFETEELLQEFALFFSEEADIVKSDKWANLKPENGKDGTVPGATLTKNHRAKISKANVGRKVSEETKSKISASHKNQSLETRIKRSEARKGMKHSDDTKNKMSQSRKGKPILGSRLETYNKSKIGKKVFIGPEGQHKMFFFGNQPEGWYLKCERLKRKLCPSIQ